MNLKRISSACAAVALCAAAYAASMPVGYCLGVISDNGISKVGNATISGAVILPADLLAPYSGAVVTGVRIGLVTADGVEDLTGWVRGSLDGENLDGGAVESPVAGWNEAALASGVVIDGTPLAVGYSFHQQKSVKCISLVGDNREDGKWICKNGKWEESSSKGVVSVELIIESDDIPATNLSILSMSSAAMPVAYGDDLTFRLDIANTALTPAEGFSVDFYVEEECVGTLAIDEEMDYGKVVSVELTLSSEVFPADIPLAIEARLVCEADGYSVDDVASVSFGSYTLCVPRKVLVEEFTTEQCPNCPRAINTLHQCEIAGYGDGMTVLAHHSGFYTDWLTLDEDLEYLWFYDPTGKEGTYAPAVMLDRTVLEGKYVPVNSIGYFQDFEPVLQSAMAVPAFVAVGVDAEAEGRMLSIDIDIERLPLLDVVGGAPRLTVCLVEDGILHHSQAGISSDTFTHSHVNRGSVTDVWGDEIEWEDYKATMHYEAVLDEEWNAENISVVAFVHETDREDVSACKVFNSASRSLGSSGVGMNADSEIVTEEFYALDGIRLKSAPRGVHIVKSIFSDGGSKSRLSVGK